VVGGGGGGGAPPLGEQVTIKMDQF
jgi:hypothetical protein